MRRIWDYLLQALCAVCGLLACGLLLAIVGYIALRAWPTLSWSFLFEGIRDSGMEGGIWDNLCGTVVMILAAMAICSPFATAIALVERVYLRSSRCRSLLMLGLHALNGLPSIIFGIFGLLVFVEWLNWGKSWLAGGILLAAVILPTVCVSMIERIKNMPAKYVQAATSLGLTECQIVWFVIMPQSISGLLTGLFLGLARAAGETAPIMFTATIFSGAPPLDGVRDHPVLTLPYHIFILAQDAMNPATEPRLWTTALVLVGLVGLFSLAGLLWRQKAHEESRF